jgi:hypothetical protein
VNFGTGNLGMFQKIGQPTNFIGSNSWAWLG